MFPFSKKVGHSCARDEPSGNNLILHEFIINIYLGGNWEKMTANEFFLKPGSSSQYLELVPLLRLLLGLKEI